MASPQYKKNEVLNYSLLSEMDIYLFKEGKHFHLYEKLGAHIIEIEGAKGTYFALWAPNAESVSVIGDFNGWNRESHHLYVRWDGSGIFEGFIPGVTSGCKYKYCIYSKLNGQILEKGDPFAFLWETPSKTASIVWDLNYSWNEQKWQMVKANKNSFSSPISIYEIHYGSWKKNSQGYSLSYREMAEHLPSYLKEMGFTHVEFMPMMEHPFYGSWGYQKTGYFSPSSRYGSPQDFMYLIETLHQYEIGVYLDWVPSHFPSDGHGLHFFDGTYLYEHEDRRKGFHPEWKSIIFNYGRNEVKSFLISSAIFWLDKYHVDGLRVDAVSSMLYLDYSRTGEEWVPNEYGGRENLEAISFLKELNEYAYKSFSDIQMIAEESTAWPMVTHPIAVGGLGFGMKWDMGWMHDTLKYMSMDPIYRKYHHNHLLFNLYYFYSENFLLSLSHDEVVYGKGSLVKKMPGDDWQKFANLRLLFGYMFTHPGKKLLFMGCEIGQWNEWDYNGQVDWFLVDHWPHKGMQRLVRDLNRVYVNEKALYECDFIQQGFSWCVLNDSDNSIIAYLRLGRDPKDQLLVVCNFTPVSRENYHINLSCGGQWREILNTDLGIYGGSDFWKNFTLSASPQDDIEHPFSLSLKVPPLSTIILKKEG